MLYVSIRLFGYSTMHTKVNNLYQVYVQFQDKLPERILSCQRALLCQQSLLMFCR